MEKPKIHKPEQIELRGKCPKCGKAKKWDILCGTCMEIIGKDLEKHYKNIQKK